MIFYMSPIKNRYFPSQGKLAFGIGTLDYLSTQAHLYNEKQLPCKAIKCCVPFPGEGLLDEAFNQVGHRAICLLRMHGRQAVNLVERKPCSPGPDFLYRPSLKVHLQAPGGCFQARDVSSAFSGNSGQEGIYSLPLFLNFQTCGQSFLLIILSALVFFPQ